MTERLENSIEGLYEAFQKYQSGPKIIGSPLYEDKDLNKWNRRLFKKHLRELDEDDLAQFVGSAIFTWGTANDYKHFLPRIFELTAEFRTPSYEVWVAFDKLKHEEFGDWPQEEQEAIDEYLIALWEYILNDNSEIAEREFKDYFSSIARIHSNFSELLNTWAESESKAGMKHLVNFIVDEQNTLFKRRRISGFYDKKENAEEFIKWILSDLVLNKMEKMFPQFGTEKITEKIIVAQEIILTESLKE